MSKIIVDASAVLAWLFNESGSAHAVKKLLDSRDLVAPWLWRIEMTNNILVRERRKILSPSDASVYLRLIDNLSIEIIPEPAARTAFALAEIARPHQLTSYDAIYLDLAIRLNLPLFTKDNNLRLAATRSGIKLIVEK